MVICVVDSVSVSVVYGVSVSVSVNVVFGVSFLTSLIFCRQGFFLSIFSRLTPAETVYVD